MNRLAVLLLVLGATVLGPPITFSAPRLGIASCAPAREVFTGWSACS